ncbi:hypothetical protein Pelo_18744 [Pelomyxa schiedti]|nr:hypothetical protein Pelo_18744 [Pelomyxa schiedti]
MLFVARRQFTDTGCVVKNVPHLTRPWGENLHHPPRKGGHHNHDHRHVRGNGGSEVGDDDEEEEEEGSTRQEAHKRTGAPPLCEAVDDKDVDTVGTKRPRGLSNSYYDPTTYPQIAVDVEDTKAVCDFRILYFFSSAVEEAQTLNSTREEIQDFGTIFGKRVLNLARFCAMYFCKPLKMVPDSLL